ncbi:MAG: sigma-70 family RNA polymerase sigma factor [Flavihumibacter sp.]
MPEDLLLPDLFRTEYRKIVSVLCKAFGIVHIEAAEDLVNDTFLLAAETWGLKGIPADPVAWLYVVAKNKTKDYLRRNRLFSEKIAKELSSSQAGFEACEIDLSAGNINDSTLRMMFAVCNPVIPPAYQVGLALRVLCGFGIEEIAAAFLTNRETIVKRLQRAKEKLRSVGMPMELPDERAIDSRLDAVLATLYLLFNEGYYSVSRKEGIRKELCVEAMRLNLFLLENEKTNKPSVNALMSLMCFHASRFDARLNEAGEMILYYDQDRSLWNDDLIARGNYYLVKSASGPMVSRYHLEASIAYWHCKKNDGADKWENILQLYNRLLQLEHSPVIALNRVYALSKTRGKEKAIAEAVKLELGDYHFYHTLLGNLYTGIDTQKAIGYYETALSLAKTAGDRRIIARYLEALQP